MQKRRRSGLGSLRTIIGRSPVIFSANLPKGNRQEKSEAVMASMRARHRQTQRSQWVESKFSDRAPV
jgi:hypothetical protein